jgi:hypothetical protein
MLADWRGAQTMETRMVKRKFLPPEEWTSALDDFECAIGSLLKDVFEPWTEYGRYEADVEVRLLFLNLLRHTEAVIECARIDPVSFAAAATLTRTVLEQSTRVRWMLAPQDVWEREARFLAHLSDEERMWDRCARASGKDEFRSHAAPLKQFREAVEKLLPAHVPRLARIPSFERILAELKQPEHYAAYTVLSQFSHGSHYAGSIYRRHLGTAKELSERVELKEWGGLLKLCWSSIFAAAQAIEQTCARRAIRSMSSENITAMNSRFDGFKALRYTVKTGD